METDDIDMELDADDIRKYTTATTANLFSTNLACKVLVTE